MNLWFCIVLVCHCWCQGVHYDNLKQESCFSKSECASSYGNPSMSGDTQPATTSPRPYIRNAMARAMYSKMMEDQEDRNSDHAEWYAVKKQKIGAPYRDLFVQMDQDDDTRAFLNQSYEKSEAMFTQIYHQVAKTVLYWFMSSTSINGLLQRGSMFVFSEKQFESLMHIDPSWKANKLLDLGAGDGMVTRFMARHFKEVFATEMSITMQWRLQEKGFKLLGLEEWNNGSHQFDVIACLNLLDRCDKPVSLLHDMKKALVPETGRIVVALVLPFKPYVEYKRDHSPEQNLQIQGSTFEEQLTHFIHDVFLPAGLTVTAFTRLPYLCEGDLEHSYYNLSDAVFVLKATS